MYMRYTNDMLYSMNLDTGVTTAIGANGLGL